MSEIERAADLIRRADALMITAGAGMGVDSGLPDFRGTEGFWKAYPALAKCQMDFARIASPGAFRATPQLAWGFYGHRLALYRRTEPHAGFAILRRWSALKEHGSRVFTSNVDGHFERAGFESGQVTECHGSIHYLQCLNNCEDAIWSAEGFQPEVDEENCLLRNEPPRCESCGQLARPNILMFGDGQWQASRWREQEGALAAWLRDVRNAVVVEMGAGTAIPSVRRFGEQLVHRGRARMIRINPRDPALADGTGVSLALGAREALEALDSSL